MEPYMNNHYCILPNILWGW